MQTYKNILSVINSESDCHNAMLKSIHLSSISHAKLTLLNIHHNENILFETIKPSISDKDLLESELSDLSKMLKERDIDFNIINVRARQDNVAILNTIKSGGYDLVVKEKLARQHEKQFSSHMKDWNLVRDISVPLLLVGDHTWQTNGHLLSAVETESQEYSHLSLNENILRNAMFLANVLSNDIHLVNCFLGEKISMSILNTEQDHQPEISEQSTHFQHLVDLTKKASQQPMVHIIQGLPEEGIASTAEKYQANIVVLGASEHHSLTNMMLGHTSEYIIDNLTCDVLTINPSISANQVH